jgi:hypothetical protein
MSRKTTRIAALVVTLVAVGLMSIAASASAAVTPVTGENCPGFFIGAGLEKPVNGSLTVKKLNQSVELKNGAFRGLLGLCLENESKLNGSITKGTVTIPAFTAPIKILGIPSEVGLEITQVGPGEGTITKPAGEECTEPQVHCNANGELLVALNVQAQANITFTTIKILGITVPTKCTTVKPVSLPFVKELTLFELLEETTITGTTTMPAVRCEGPLGLLESAALTALFSGPNNPYSLTFGETTVLPPEQFT